MGVRMKLRGRWEEVDRKKRGKSRGTNIPLNYFITDFFQTGLDLCDIHIFTPGLLALPGWLFVLGRGALYGSSRVGHDE